MKQGEKHYKETFSKVFKENTALFDDCNYVYTGSLVLFRTIPHRKKIPEDIDVALDRNGKGTKELVEFYRKIKKHPKVERLMIKTVFEKEYMIRKKKFRVEKYQPIDPDIVDPELFEILLESGNIRVKYYIFDVAIELFPEKNGNGLTNLGVMDKGIQQVTIKTEGGTMKIPLLSHKAIAQGYVMNFLKEIIRNNVYRFTDLHSQPKDGIRLFSIISLLERQGEDASPTGVLKFIKKTVRMYKKIPQHRRSKYIDSAIHEFPRIEKMMQKIINEYHGLIKRKDSKKYKFVNFYKKLRIYKQELNNYMNYLQKYMLALLKKNIIKKNYAVMDMARLFSPKEKIYDKIMLKKISENLNKITKNIEHIGIKNRNESFVYFYEMYMLKNLFIKPIVNLHPGD